jgi:hypothetical protein
MDVAITRTISQEERELNKRLKQLEKLEVRLTQRELDLATMRAELRAIDLLYIRRVGARLTQLQLIEARIAEILGRLNPEDEDKEERAREAREHAEETRQKTKRAEAASEDSTTFKPSEELRALYREAAKNIHPDLATNDADREIRNQWMAEINAAYQAGDEERLAALLKKWRSSPEAVQGNGLSALLERTMRKIARIKDRLKAIKAEMDHLKDTFAFSLRRQMQAAEKEGRDLLDEMAAKIEKQIQRKQRMLESLMKNAPPMWKIEW